MRVLVACECSGAVRSAFRALGHEAYSCDLLPAEDHGPHILCEHDLHLLDIIEERPWDMLIAFPPCTHLASSGARYFAQKRIDGRQQQARDFFMALVNAPVEHIAIENPVGVMSSFYRKPDQIIQPWQFGHPESKATCLWLKNLPLLKPTRILRARSRWNNQTPSGQNRLGPSPERAAIRARTYAGIATAMARQWGDL